MGNSLGGRSHVSEFEDTLQSMVNLDSDEKFSLAGKYFAELYPYLKKVDPENKGAIVLYYILGTIAGADGQLTSQEHELIEAVWNVVGMDWSVDDSLKMIKNVANKEGYETLAGIIENFDRSLVSTLIAFIAVICSIDDKINSNELQLIKDLINIAG